MSQILIVEDESIIRSALRRLLERNEYGVSEASSVQEALEQHDVTDFDLIISDLRLPGAQGTDLIHKAEGVPVLIMTSYASLRSAVDSMKMGAVDYIAKPFDHDEMLMSVNRILKEGTLVRQNAVLKSQIASDHPVTGMIGNCPAMQEVFNRINKVAALDTTVLILGESGTGKELAARALHEKSARANAPMISVNCAAIPESLIESELFGHEKGAFTGAAASRHGLVEAADGGTLFLDEIGELPLEAQARLLRALQEGEIRRVGSVQSKKVNIRLIAATHRNLKQLAQDGGFREDLYYRLNVLELKIPPLRERGSDILELADQLLNSLTKKLGKSQMFLGPEARQAINKYTWPGNVRELENAIERAVILNEDEQITPELLAIDYSQQQTMAVTSIAATPKQQASPLNTAIPPAPESAEDLSLEDYFQHFVLEHQDQMTETELAQKLGISRKCLWERRQRLGIPRKSKVQF